MPAELLDEIHSQLLSPAILTNQSIAKDLRKGNNIDEYIGNMEQQVNNRPLRQSSNVPFLEF